MKDTFNAIANFLEETVPDAQLKKGIVISFDIKKRYAKEGHVRIAPSLTEPEKLRLELALEFPDSDMKMSHFFPSETKLEIITRFRSAEGQAELLRSVESLDESIRLHD